MPHQQDISIKIADVPRISMTIPSDTEEVVRRAEYNVNKVFNKWKQDFHDKTSKEVLAMVAFQFAKSYYQLRIHTETQQKLLEEFENELNRLLDIDTPDPTPEEPTLL